MIQIVFDVFHRFLRIFHDGFLLNRTDTVGKVTQDTPPGLFAEQLGSDWASPGLDAGRYDNTVMTMKRLNFRELYRRAKRIVNQDLNDTGTVDNARLCLTLLNILRPLRRLNDSIDGD
ncbi:hypothetical protein JCM14469_27670 [Desulfatiferula olefinivorans]